MGKRSIKRDKDYPIYQAGVRDGRQEMRVEVLTYLEQRYANREVVRGSTLAKAILEVASDLATWLRGQLQNPVKQSETDAEKSE